MINRQEIADFSREFGLTANVIEKDYMLGWLLSGISNHSELSASWAFKGGTCLKKCYFETYRFSEDLDFTLTAAEHQDERFQKHMGVLSRLILLSVTSTFEKRRHRGRFKAFIQSLTSNGKVIRSLRHDSHRNRFSPNQ